MNTLEMGHGMKRKNSEDAVQDMKTSARTQYIQSRK